MVHLVSPVLETVIMLLVMRMVVFLVILEIQHAAPIKDFSILQLVIVVMPLVPLVTDLQQTTV